MSPTLTPLELLPSELLQYIFHLSGYALSLPLSSRLLSSKLSDPYTLRNVCIHYLKPTPEGAFAAPPSLQSQLFTFKWLTWQFFKDIYLTKTYAEMGCLCGSTACADPIWPPDFDVVAQRMSFDKPRHLPELSYLKCRLPAKLLHGPWTNDKIAFLRFLLLTTGMTVDWADSATRALVNQGRKDAVLERALGAVDAFNNNLRLGKSPGVAHIRFSVLEGGCDRSVVFNTMVAARKWSLREYEWDFGDLVEWAKEREREGDRKGMWLKVKLRELGGKVEKRGEGKDGEMYWDWGLDPRIGDYEEVGDRLVVVKDVWGEMGRKSTRRWPESRRRVVWGFERGLVGNGAENAQV